jgi:8-oxo-dGTP pyrophosphatase MutT (NUDIX family)
LDDYREMSGEVPELVRDEAIELAELGGPGAELSTGLILTWHDWLVFGLEPRAIPLGAQGQAGIAAFVGIGGHRDPGEGWIQAAIREAQEEANCRVSLGDSAMTYLCRPDQAPCPITYHWDEPYRPLLVWVATFDLRRGPDRARVPVTLVNPVFHAAALGQPSPGAEIQALLLLDQETLLHTYAAPRPLGELLLRGARVIGDFASVDTLVAPGGSAFFYAQWLVWQS